MILDSLEVKEKILGEFLQLCPIEGWGEETLILAMKNCDIEEKFLPLIFENGALDLANFYIDFQNKKLAEKTAKIDGFLQKKIRDKIRLCLYLRFELEDKIILQRLNNFYLNPKNFINFKNGARPLIQGVGAYFKISDFIWKNIDDQSTDFNFYTKRLTLARIINKSLKVFLKDDDVNLSHTKNFIDDEIEKVMQFEKKKFKIKNILQENLFDETGKIKSPKELVKKLPFFRLIKKK